jgi:hypothetical protein
MKKKRFANLAVTAVATALLLSDPACKVETPEQKSLRQYNEMETAYANADLQTVERVLTNYLQTISDEENHRVKGKDYQMAKTIVHERLFLIYRHTGETNKMQHEFDQSMEWLGRFNRYHGRPPPTFTVDSLAAVLEKSESGKEKWKNQN